MNLRKIIALDKKAAKEAQKAVDKIYKSYSKEMNRLIAAQIPKGVNIFMGNGLILLVDAKTNERITYGKAWGINSEDEKLDRISALQYSESDVSANWFLELELKGTKPLTPIKAQ